jgi:hypothetical protein
MLQEMLTKTNGKVNQIIYWGSPLDWRNQTLTPNPHAIYFMAFFNTKEVGPIVFDIPPGEANASPTGNIVTVWQIALEDVGLLGLDKGAGGKFVVLPPGYKDKAPDGYTVLPSDTDALLRSALRSHGDADVAVSIAYGWPIPSYRNVCCARRWTLCCIVRARYPLGKRPAVRCLRVRHFRA